jgi:hypothetical protein
VSQPEPTSAVPLPAQPSERRAWLIACATCALGAAVLAAVLAGVVGGGGTLAPPPVPAVAATPGPAAAAPASVTAQDARRAGAAAIVTSPSGAQQRLDAGRLTGATEVRISRRWMEGFYPIYATAQSTFGVNWLLLASIHMQESAFSTAPSTYSGLNFAHCCGGPMQFNVTNGPVTTWALVSDSYLYGRRPASYDHMTRSHPSIYDDFDAIMAAAHLLSADGAGYALARSAWDAAYDYYGHDLTGVLYADQVLARAIGWSQHGFCINCGVRTSMIEAVDAAYGAPVRAALLEEQRDQEQAQQRSRRAARARPRRPAPRAR